MRYPVFVKESFNFVLNSPLIRSDKMNNSHIIDSILPNYAEVEMRLLALEFKYQYDKWLKDTLKTKRSYRTVKTR